MVGHPHTRVTYGQYSSGKGLDMLIMNCRSSSKALAIVSDLYPTGDQQAQHDGE